MNGANKATDTFQSALSTAAVTADVSAGVTAQISAAAKAQSSRPAAPQFDASYFDHLGVMPEDEMKSEVTKQANAISASQGLSNGKFDFTSLTGGQAQIVAISLLNTPGTNHDAIGAFANNITYDMLDSTMQHDFVKPIAAYAEYSKSSDPASVGLFNETLALFASRSANNATSSRFDLYKAPN